MIPNALTVDDVEDDRYVVRNRLEVVAVLRGLKESKALIAACVDDGSDFIVTAITDFAPERDEIMLGVAPESKRNAALLAGQRVVCFAALEGVKVKFELDDAKIVETDGYEAFSASIPGELVRVQRREYYRIPAPIGTPLMCLIPDTGTTAELMAMDLSAGGLCLIDHARASVLKVGQRYRGCRMTLPDAGALTFDIAVRACTDARLPNGSPFTRAGCEFIDLKGPAQGLIQRYINTLERTRNFRKR